MDNTDARLDIIEAPRSTDVSQELVTVAPSMRSPQVSTPSKGQGTQPPTNVSTTKDTTGNTGEGTPPPRRTAEAVELLNNFRLSDLFDPPDKCVKMDPGIFSGVSNGSNKIFENFRSSKIPMACLKSVQGDSVLHLAARWNHPELVESIISECPCLLFDLDSKGQLPIHVAAHAGNLAVVQAIVKNIIAFSAMLCEEERGRWNVYAVKNVDGDTPLHLALKRRFMKVAACLVEANQQASFLENNEGISPVYMAVESGGDVSLVKAMLGNEGISNSDEDSSLLEGRKYLAHAALNSKSTDILNVILTKYPNLVDEQDAEGRTCLSFGVLIGFKDGVSNLLARSPKSVYVCNQDGSFPIHIAVERCEFRILDEILRRCPDSKHLLNKQGRNMLHIAANFGHHRLVRTWMFNDETCCLGLGQDVYGNTPLHLATINWHSNCIFPFAWDERILQLRNNRGQRAWDIANSRVKPNYVYRQRLTLALLLYATHSFGEPVESVKTPTDPTAGKYKDYINTLLLVAALVATMTFAAGFTMPGGFNSSGPHLGRATLANNPTLFIFLLVDTLAMHSSVATIATLIWAQMGDRELVRSSVKVALPLLSFSLLCMPLAFFFGMVTAIAHVTWFLTAICVISSIFFYWVFLILAPHVLLQLSNVSPYYLGKYLLMLIVCEVLLQCMCVIALGIIMDWVDLVRNFFLSRVQLLLDPDFLMVLGQRTGPSGPKRNEEAKIEAPSQSRNQSVP